MANLEKLKVEFIIPQAATNLVTNPSFETGTTGYTSVGGATLTRVATHQRRGAWALQITPVSGIESGAYFGTVSVTSGMAYTFAVDVKGVDGETYKISLQTTTPTERASTSFISNGEWQRPEVTFTATATESWRLYIVRDASETGTDNFYIDGLQFEEGAKATTYFDGDSIGFVRDRKDFGWNGARHASTSYRTAKTRAGGALFDLSDYASIVKSYGLGMGNFTQTYIPIQTGGALYEKHTRNTRPFSFMVDFNGSQDAQVANRSAVINAIRPDYTDDQPMIVRVAGVDASGNDAGDPVDIVCWPEESLLDSPENPFHQRDVLRFRARDAVLPGAFHEGVELDFADSLANADYILYRDRDGVWNEMGTGLNGAVYTISEAPNGDIYIGGAFTDAGGDTDADYLCKWDGSSFSSVVAGINDSVRSLVFDASGNLYIGGSFTNLGDANGDNVVMWDGSSVNSLGTGGNGVVYAMAITSNGNVYAGGTFSSMGGVADTDSLAMWDGSSWNSVSTDINNDVYALVADVNNLYIGGSFNVSGGSSANRIAKWDGSTLSTFGAGANLDVRTIVIANNKDLYIGGGFTSVGGVSANRCAVWSGSSWSPLGDGVDGRAYSMAIDLDNVIYLGGAFGTAGGLSLTDRIAAYKSRNWDTLQIDLPGSGLVRCVFVTSNNELYIGFGNSGEATIAGSTSTTSESGAISHPSIRIDGPGSIHKIINNTADAKITFNNLTLLTGEVLTINFEPGNISAVSSFQGRGNCLNYIAPGSNLANFYLQPGTNSISLLMTGTDGDTDAVMYWPPNFWSIDQTKHEV